MDHVSTLLAKALNKRGLLKHAQASLAVTKAQQWLEEHVKDASAVSLKEGILTVACINSIAAQEAHEASDDLKKYLIEECECKGLEEIRIIRE